MGVCGTVGGSFFRAPPWVDLNKPPGHTAQTSTPWPVWFRGVVTTASVVQSPNLVWLLVALTVYVLFPYDLRAAEKWDAVWIGQRLTINFGVTFLYVGFWFFSLYVLSWGKRKYHKANMPSIPNLIHDVWYTSLGILQWTAWEVMFLRLYATGRLDYMSDSEVWGSWRGRAVWVLWTLFIPLWRGLHFYAAHRLLHVWPLYKYVHSLHHRNTDVNPFAGLAMHPVEHLYYFSCVLPSLYFRMSPFHLLWNGIHLLLSPAASHSGWEDRKSLALFLVPPFGV